MPKVKKEFISVGHSSDPEFVKFRFNVDININADGLFYAYMPDHIITRMQFGNVVFDRSIKKDREGCFTGKSMPELIGKIKQACIEASSRREASRTIIIKYAIRTSCAYCISEKEIVPNGGWVKGGNYDWKKGTVNQHATSPFPFGFEMYAKPFFKMEYLYCNGRTSIEYLPIYDQTNKKDHYYLDWLSEVCSVAVPKDTEIQEIEYTEDIARFFVDAYKSICELNERIKGLLHPDGIRLIADNKTKLLGWEK